jgi:hypothetical protein
MNMIDVIGAFVEDDISCFGSQLPMVAVFGVEVFT